MKIAVLSDIHANLTALNEVMKSIALIGGLILLGDLIDYGPHSNEIIKLIIQCKIPILCNILGNHEQAIISENYSRFSSQRGKLSAQFTRKSLNSISWEYITTEMYGKGFLEFNIDGYKCLAVHGSLDDVYWKSIKVSDNLEKYKPYDYVFSGHSHIPHFFEEFYEVDDAKHRNKKKTVFINPGSVGQPRNHNPMAQYAIWDTVTGEVTMAKIPYNITKEQQAFSPEIDIFYKERLESGI